MVGHRLWSPWVHRLCSRPYKFLGSSCKLAGKEGHSGRRGKRHLSPLPRVCGDLRGAGPCRVTEFFLQCPCDREESESQPRSGERITLRKGITLCNLEWLVLEEWAPIWCGGFSGEVTTAWSSIGHRRSW